VQPGRLAVKDGGLWTRWREFESLPGYQSFSLMGKSYSRLINSLLFVGDTTKRVMGNQLLPRKYETKVTLRDGRTALLRPIKPEDEPMWQEMFQSFSEESIRYRFFQVIKATPQMRRRYCNIDYNKEIAIVAELNEEGKKRILGVFRLILEPNLKTGEIAFIITDQWQNLGLGSAMMHHMIKICKEKQLESIYGILLKNNIKGVKFMKNMGFTIQQLDEETVKATLNFTEEQKR
jgi:acetyltransferase